MSEILTVLPLSIVMIAGPQVISAVFFATSERWAGNSAAYVAGAAISITAIASAAFLLSNGAVDSASDENKGDVEHVIDAVVLVLLVFAAVYTYLRRKQAEPPKWMGRLQAAQPRFAFVLGLALLGVFPTDIVTSVSVGAHLGRHGDDWVQVLPFVGLTLFLLALPALLVVLLGQRAQTLLPKVRDWMNTNSWVVNEVVILFFVVITANSLLS